MNISIKAGAMMVCALAATATPSGNLSTTNITNGGVSVSATRIDWYPMINATGVPGSGDFATGGFTNISYNAGTVTATTNPYGQIKDIDIGTGPIANFIQFYSGTTLPTPAGTGALQTYPVFDLTGVLAGGSVQGALNNCAGVTAIGVACSPLVSIGGTSFVSPFILTNRGAYTDVSLGVNLLGRDATGSLAWSGGFTTQVTEQNGVRLTPDAIQSLINGGGTINNTYSGTFSASAVPEPASFALIGSGLALAYLRRRAIR